MCNYDPTLKISGSWTLLVPKNAVSQNQLSGNGKGRAGWKYRRIRDEFFELVRARKRNIPDATTRRRVFFTRYYSGKQRPYDRDNLVAGMKPLRDCLTELKLIVDDSERWLEAHYMQKHGETSHIAVDIEEIVSWN